MILPKFSCNTQIIKNAAISKDVYCLSFRAEEIAAQASPGMFVDLDIMQKDVFLRRPFGIAEANKETGVITIYYRVIGNGTRALTNCSPGHTINALGPLGRGFPTDCKNPLLVGGGMGLAPLLYVQSFYGNKADTLMGGRNISELFWRDLFAPYAGEIYLTSDDGSIGKKGFAISLLPELIAKGKYDAIFVCGPEIMMRGIAKLAAEENIKCYVSLEKRMACGLGACLSCSCDKTDGSRAKICKDGPVFPAGEVFA